MDDDSLARPTADLPVDVKPETDAREPGRGVEALAEVVKDLKDLGNALRQTKGGPGNPVNKDRRPVVRERRLPDRTRTAPGNPPVRFRTYRRKDDAPPESRITFTYRTRPGPAPTYSVPTWGRSITTPTCGPIFSEKRLGLTPAGRPDRPAESCPIFTPVTWI